MMFRLNKCFNWMDSFMAILRCFLNKSKNKNKENMDKKLCLVRKFYVCRIKRSKKTFVAQKQAFFRYEFIHSS